MKNLLYLLLFTIASSSLLADCKLYELEKDEKFKILQLGNDKFLSIFSKDFEIDFLLECKEDTTIYAKVEQNKSLENKDRFLKIQTSLDIKDIKISSAEKTGNIKEIRFLNKDKFLNVSIKENIISVNENQKGETTDYVISDNHQKNTSMPLDFQCSSEYFFNEYNIEPLSFKDENLNTDYIIKEINKYTVNRRDQDNQKLIQWHTNCKNWTNITKNIDLEDLYTIDKQILSQYSKAYKKTENILASLLQSSLQNYQMPHRVLQNFESSMNTLKGLEKNKSRYKVFNNINDIFYIRNNKDLRVKVDYMLASIKHNEYGDLLSNTKAGSFIDSSDFKIDTYPRVLNIYTLDANKDFLVAHIKSAINLNSQNTQFATYKLSNSFCSYLNDSIQKSNQNLNRKISLIKYCTQKKFGDTYVSPRAVYRQPMAQNTNTQPIYQNNNSQSYDNTQNTQEEAEEEEAKQGVCENKDNMLICFDISKSAISSHIKDGLHFPTLDDLLDNFDEETYEGWTIYAPDNKYFFFNEDEGWENIAQLEESIPVNLILIK